MGEYASPAPSPDARFVLAMATAWGLNRSYMPGSYRGVSGRSDGRRYLDWSLDTSYPRHWRGPLHMVGTLGFAEERIADI